MEILLQTKGFQLFVELFMKSSLILGIALVATTVFRKQSASFRHLVLGVSLIGLLILPLLLAFAPGWNPGFFAASWGKTGESLPISAAEEAPQRAPIPYEEMKVVKVITVTESKPTIVQNVEETPPAPGFIETTLPYGAIAIWSIGLIFILGRLGIGLYGAFKLANQGSRIDGYPWKQLFLAFLKETSLKRNVRLLKNDRLIVPMTCGVLNPAVIMPAKSENWTVEECSSVLYHELSHVKRSDFLVRLLSMTACAFYWYNPLCWVVYRKLKGEQEKACDEMVLKTGIKPSTYASHLLMIRKSIERGHYFPSPALGMAVRSEFKERMTSILKKQINLKEVKMKTKMSILIIGLLILTFIGTAKPYPAQSASDQETASTSQGAEQEKITPPPPPPPAPQASAPKAPCCKEGHKDMAKCCEKAKVTCMTEKDGGKKVTVKVECNTDEKVCVGKEHGGAPMIVRVKIDHEALRKSLEAARESLKGIELKEVDIKKILDKQLSSLENLKGKDLEQAINGALKELEKTEMIRQKALQKAEMALAKMEKELASKELKLQEIEKHMVLSEKDEVDELEEVEEAQKANECVKVVKMKKLAQVDETEPGETCKAKGETFLFVTKKQIGKDKVDAINAALAKFQDKLPKGYKLDKDIGETKQKICICNPGGKADEKADTEVKALFKEFEKEFKKIME